MAPRQQTPDEMAQEDEQRMYGNVSKEALEIDGDPKPINHFKTLPFHELFTSLFNPLSENNKKKPPASKGSRGQRGTGNLSAHEQRDLIISRFISRWRQEVGNDIYPAMRLILPEKDKERPMYGLKEKAIAKLIVKMLKLAPTSDDASSLINWKVPGKSNTIQNAGDFAGRCFKVIESRQMRSKVGNMRIAEVNELLDKLCKESKEDNQLPIFNEFYSRMNADEFTWLIRIILRQMKVGASEKTILNLWHPDGESEFNHTSSLKGVCWKLTDPEIRVGEERGILPMQCFQPQLAQFAVFTFEQIAEKLGSTGTDAGEDKKADRTFWIEEKLDGERMQLHMVKDTDARKYPGGYRFGFWSRRGTDYTYLYGNSFGDDKSALTRHIKDAFDPGLDSIILDGEMITWNPVTNTMVGFGTLKSAAISEKANPYDGTGDRPLFRAFDCLYFNGQDLTKYQLRKRREVMSRVIKDVDKRLEIHKYTATTLPGDIEAALARVVEESAEGLVIKDPRSAYRLNSRNDDWIKVKPEYMTGFGENFDCAVIGAYFGQGHRGGNHASFLCGLRVNDNHIKAGANPERCYSFFKVGGGFRANDLAKIRHMTENKWQDWDKNNPPTEYIHLAGGNQQHERPDQWIRPSDSFVLEAKAASIGGSERFATGFTLRFPRFKRLREDKKWDDAFSIYECQQLKEKVEAEGTTNKAFQNDGKRKIAKRLKPDLTIAGNDTKIKTPYAGPETQIFKGLNFCVMSEMLHPSKKSKTAIEQIIKSNGGKTFASATAQDHVLCIGDKRTVPVASLIKNGELSVVKPAWLLDAVKQAEIDGYERTKLILPFEKGHMFHTADTDAEDVEGATDIYGDSYARDVTTEELRVFMETMYHPKHSGFDSEQFLAEMEERGDGLGELHTEIFRRCVLRFISEGDEDTDMFLAKQQVLFAGGRIAEMDDDQGITHFVVVAEHPKAVRKLLQGFSTRSGRRMPRIVDFAWVTESWHEKTLLDEERYVVS